MSPATPPPDEHLRAALRHAPDAQAAPPAALSAAIRRAAHAATASSTLTPPERSRWAAAWMRGWERLCQPRVAAGLASVLMAGVVTLMWQDQPLPAASSPTARAPEALRPAASAPPALATERRADEAAADASAQPAAPVAAAPLPRPNAPPAHAPKVQPQPAPHTVPLATDDRQPRSADAAAQSGADRFKARPAASREAEMAVAPEAGPARAPARAETPAPAQVLGPAAPRVTAPAPALRDGAVVTGQAESTARRSAPAGGAATAEAGSLQALLAHMSAAATPSPWRWQRDGQAAGRVDAAALAWLRRLITAAPQPWTAAAPATGPLPEGEPVRWWRGNEAMGVLVLGASALHWQAPGGAWQTTPVPPEVMLQLRAP